ncbi:Oxysterol-binding protein [Venturia nashicola]|uniref:Oxysterol-binding protein n=1 Tax=Venturia nashicola TaxID=86259 RepID=A0A4Z1NXN9_9PEZI|nr:Oxysterol-binding protein [Venturia nashicola]
MFTKLTQFELPGNRSSLDDSRDGATDDETVVDPEQGNVLGHIISQLRPGADLSRVTLPTFILEPRSMLERITNFMAHPEILLTLPGIVDPVERFVAVTKFYLCGWHIKPPGVKKPLNPILGETYTGWWDYPDGTKGYYISEQTSHHPPKSSYFFMAPEHNIRIDGTLKPRSKFLGNSAASLMEGIAVLRFLNHKERYFITQPNMYARGILFGKMKYELGDHAFLKSPESGLMADIEFKTKGYFGGTYNAIQGFIKDTKTDKNLFEITGYWNGEMFIKNLTTGKKDLLFDASKARETYPHTRPVAEQEERESVRLWEKVNIAIKNKDHNAATDEKSRIENMQREEAAKRADEGVDWRPRLFRAVQGGPGGQDEGEEDLNWIISAKIDGRTPEEQVKQILNIAAILPGQQPNRRFSIPERNHSLDKVPQHDVAQAGMRPAPVSQASVPTTEGKGDLIDFREEALTQHPPTSKPAPGYTDIKDAPVVTGMAPTGNLAHGMQTMNLNKGPDRVASPSLHRMDTETHTLDEFHDAEAGNSGV